MNDQKIAFELKKIRLPLEKILPVRKLTNPEGKIARYATILASIKELGMIEPLMVFPQKGNGGTYLIMDGHLRLYALKELGYREADCLIATQDESYTYNARISRLAPIQEHAMIKKAVENGVPPERIAATLNMKVSEVKATLRLLGGVNM